MKLNVYIILEICDKWITDSNGVDLAIDVTYVRHVFMQKERAEQKLSELHKTVSLRYELEEHTTDDGEEWLSLL